MRQMHLRILRPQDEVAAMAQETLLASIMARANPPVESISLTGSLDVLPYWIDQSDRDDRRLTGEASI